MDSAGIEVVKLSRATWAAGAERHEREGTTLWGHRPAKAVADCFKFRKRLGPALDLTALNSGVVDPQELANFGELCRVRIPLADYLALII
jgi:hypothetical protein